MKKPTKVGGVEAILETAMNVFRDRIVRVIDNASGTTPIEQLFAAALEARLAAEGAEYKEFYVVHSDDEEAEHTTSVSHPGPTVVLRPQVIFELDGGDWIVDFTVAASAWSSSLNKAYWRWLVVECDGHDFHERTKAQAARDRSRDRELVLMGRDVMRFTGSEIWNDPWRCAGDVIRWISKGLA